MTGCLFHYFFLIRTIGASIAPVMRVLLCFLCALLIGMSHAMAFTTENSALTNPQTQADISANVKQVADDPDLSIEEKITILEQYSQQSESHQWVTALFDAKSAILGLLINFERMQEADKLVLDIQTRLYDQLNYKQQINFKRYELWVADSLSQQNKISSTRSDLMVLMAEAENFESEKEYYLGLIHLALGQSQADSRERSKAILHYKQAFTLFDKIKDFQNLSYVLGSLGTLYIAIENPRKAIDYFEQQLVAQKTLASEYEESVTWYNLSLAYQDMDNDTKAREALAKSKAISVKLNDEVGIAWCDQNLAYIELESKHYGKALALYENVMPVFAKSHGVYMQYTVMFGMATAHLGLQDLAKAEEYFRLSEPLYEKIKSPVSELRRTLFKTELAYKKGDFEHIFKDMKRALDMQEDILKKAKNSLVEKYIVEFDTAFQEKKNEELIAKNQLSELKISQQNQQRKLWILLIVASFVCTFVIALLLIKQNKLRKEFKALALHDPLTNQPNRRSILDMATSTLNASNTGSLVIAIIDIDFFKKINDRFGHEIGDNVLKVFGQSCKAAIRAQDSFGRYGGEEWLFVLKDADETTLHEVFKRIFERVNANPIEGLPQSEGITFSMGAAIIKDMVNSEQYNLTALISIADAQLYAAKNQGRNRYTYEIVNKGSETLKT